MNQSAAGTLNQYPNLIELIGRHSALQGAAVWWESAIGSDELSDGAGLDPLPDARENFLQDEIVNGPLNAVSVSGQSVIGQDEVEPLFKVDAMSICSDETIGQDEFGSPPAGGLDTISICNDENFLRDEDPSITQAGTTLAS